MKVMLRCATQVPVSPFSPERALQDNVSPRFFWLVPDLWPAHLLVDETPVSFKDRHCAVNSLLLGAVYFTSVSNPPLGFLNGGGDNSGVAGQRRRDTLQVHG